MTGSIEKRVENPNLTLKALAEKWIKEYGEKNLAPKTLFRYKELLDTRIIPAIGHMKIAKIKPMHLLEFYNNLTEDGIRLDTKYIAKEGFIEIISKSGLTLKDLSAKCDISERTIKNLKERKSIQCSIAVKISKALRININTLFDENKKSGGLSPTTIKHHHRLIHAIFESAVKWQLLHINPASNATPPKCKKTEAEFLEEEEIEQLLAALDSLDKSSLKYKAGAYIPLSSGVRLGELMGLTWKSIDPVKKTITIEQANQYLSTHGTFNKDPKNYTSKRINILPEEVFNILEKYKLYQNEQKLKLGSLWKDTDFLFTQLNGGMMHPTTMTKWFTKFVLDNNLKKITFHQLRHYVEKLVMWSENASFRNQIAKSCF